MSALRIVAPIIAVSLALAGCATRPINAPIAQAVPDAGYRYQTLSRDDPAKDTLVVLAFSYGVLEALRDTRARTRTGQTVRLLDEVDIITGVSGGSFTALAYGLYGDRLFDEYERRFLKRNVQGELARGLFNPMNRGALWSGTYGRSEMAADLYDDILFDHKTFGDLAKRRGPFIVATATDISTGSRLAFIQSDFDLLCSDVETVPLARAAAASSAVPLVMSPVTLNNYGGTCHYQEPPAMRALLAEGATSRPAGRSIQRFREMRVRTGDGPAVAAAGGAGAPDIDVYAIDVSFDALADAKERAYLNELPTSFRLSDEEVDRLRAAARRILLESPDFRRLARDVGATILPVAAAQ